MARRSPTDKPLSAEDQRLWSAVTQSVRALPDGASFAAMVPDVTPMAPPPKAAGGPPLRRSEPEPTGPDGPRLDVGDPKQARRVARGRTPIDATLDLHGMRQLEAERQLERFVMVARAHGHRTLLIITGKGPPDAEFDPFEDAPRGILRRRFLEWVEQAPLRGMISGVRQAHIRHGGRGAFYVFLRRGR